MCGCQKFTHLEHHERPAVIGHFLTGSQVQDSVRTLQRLSDWAVSHTSFALHPRGKPGLGRRAQRVSGRLGWPNGSSVFANCDMLFEPRLLLYSMAG